MAENNAQYNHSHHCSCYAGFWPVIALANSRKIGIMTQIERVTRKWRSALRLGRGAQFTLEQMQDATDGDSQ